MPRTLPLSILSARAAQAATIGALGAASLLLAGCGATATGGPASPGASSGSTSSPATPGDCVPLADPAPVDLAGLTANDILLVDRVQLGVDTISPGYERLVVYRDGRVAALEMEGWNDRDGGTGGEADSSADDVSEAWNASPAIAPAVAVHTPSHSDMTVVPILAFPPPGEVTTLQVGQLPECALTLLDEVAAELVPLVTELDGDLGILGVTDMPTIGVDYRGTAAVVAAAYGLQYEDIHGAADDLTPQQHRARELMQELRQVVIEHTGPLSTVEPDRIDLYGATDGCTTISDPHEIAEYLEDNPAGAVIRGLAPGIAGCSETTE